jgi:hypothetical protein
VTADIGTVIEDEDNAPADSPGTEALPPADAQSADEGTFSEPDMETGTTRTPAAPPRRRNLASGLRSPR